MNTQPYAWFDKKEAETRRSELSELLAKLTRELHEAERELGALNEALIEFSDKKL